MLAYCSVLYYQLLAYIIVYVCDLIYCCFKDYNNYSTTSFTAYIA